MTQCALITRWALAALIVQQLSCTLAFGSESSSLKNDLTGTTASWHLTTIGKRSEASLLINSELIESKPYLLLRVEPAKHSPPATRDPQANSQRASTAQDPLSPPEHYLTVTASCAGTELKSRTLATFPVGDAGLFRIQLPEFNAKCPANEGKVPVSITIELVQPDESAELDLRGEISLQR